MSEMTDRVLRAFRRGGHTTDPEDPDFRGAQEPGPHGHMYCAVTCVDLGKRRDWTTACTVAVYDPGAEEGEEDEAPSPTYEVVHLERFPGGTEYREIARQLKEHDLRVQSLLDRRHPGAQHYLVFDQSGVGDAFDEQLADYGVHDRWGIVSSLSGRPVKIWNCAKGRVRTPGRNNINRRFVVAKQDLIQYGGQIPLSEGRLRWPDPDDEARLEDPALDAMLGNVETLTAELQNYEILITPHGNETFRPHRRDGQTNDDYVCAAVGVDLSE